MATYPTESYTNLKERFKSIAGLQSLETTDEAFFRQAINRRFRTAYQRYPWYEFTVVGESVAMATADDNQIITYGSNKDLANNADTISSAPRNKAIEAGKDKNKQSSIDLFWIRLIFSLFFD